MAAPVRRARCARLQVRLRRRSATRPGQPEPRQLGASPAPPPPAPANHTPALGSARRRFLKGCGVGWGGASYHKLCNRPAASSPERTPCHSTPPPTPTPPPWPGGVSRNPQSLRLSPVHPRRGHVPVYLERSQTPSLDTGGSELVRSRSEAAVHFHSGSPSSKFLSGHPDSTSALRGHCHAPPTRRRSCAVCVLPNCTGRPAPLSTPLALPDPCTPILSTLTPNQAGKPGEVGLNATTG